MPNACSARAWSWASALDGYRYNARALASRLSTSSVGSWKHSDLPDAVPVVTIVGPAHAACTACAWWEYSRSMPRAASAPATAGCSSSGSATAFPGRRFSAACMTSRSSSRPARSSSSHGWMSRTTLTSSDARRSDGPAEPGQGKSAAEQQEQQRAAGEGHRDLLLDLLGGEPRAEARVDLLELRGVGGLVEAALADAGDLLERLRVRWDLDPRGQAEGVLDLDLAVGRAERDREDRDAGLAGLLGDLDGADAALGVLAVGEQYEHGRQPPRARAVGVRDRRLRRLEAALEAESHRGAADRRQAIQRAAHGGAVGRRRRAHLGEVRERDEAEPEGLRQLVGEPLGRVDRRRDPVRLDVGGVHRAGDVGDHHHRRRALGRRDRALRAGERHDQRGEREQEQQRRDVAAQARPRRDEVRHQRRVGEGRGLAALAGLHRRIHERGERHEHEADQQDGLAEAHAACSGPEGASGTAAFRRATTAARDGAPARSAASPRRRWWANSRSQSPSVDSTTWSAPARRSDAATCSRSAAAAAAKRSRTLRREVLTGTWRPVSGSITQMSPIGVSCCSRGSRISTAITPWRPRSERSGPSQSGAPRKSETTTTSPRARASAATLVTAAPTDVPPAPSPPGSRRSSLSSPSRPSRPWRGLSTRGSPPPKASTPRRLPRRVATCPTASATPSATSALRRSAVPKLMEADTSSTSQHVSARSPTCTRTCGSLMRAVTFQSMWRTSSPGR